MLGVRRQSLGAVIKSFQERGLIRTERGRVTMFDRVGLEATSCECYAIVREAYSAILPCARGSMDGPPAEGADG
jgi:hypothetical protein